MKYIKTEDGIFAFEGVNTVTKVYETPKGIEPWRYRDGTIVKEGDKFIRANNKDYKVVKENTADTIEELCDEFVIKGTRGLYLGIPLQECELRNIPTTQIYGAIWTDKGLIYVAKMNERGCLELL